MSLNFERRFRGLQKRMVESDIDLVVYGSGPNFQYLTGSVIEWRRGIDLQSPINNIFVPQQGQPILTTTEELAVQASKTWVKDIRTFSKDTDFKQQLKKVISDQNLTGNRIGLGDFVRGSTVAHIAKEVKGAKFYAAEALMDQLRVVKDSEEIRRLRSVARHTDKTMEKIVQKIKKGVTQRELELQVELEGRMLGASDVSFSPSVVFVKWDSEVSKDVSLYPREKGLEFGTTIAFDIGFVMEGYCSDFGRSFHFGPAKKEVKNGYTALQQAMTEALDEIHVGRTRVCDLLPAVEKTLDRLEYGDRLRADLKTGWIAHSIGVEVHEPPWLTAKERTCSEIIKENMIISLEPRLWRAGKYYLRVEDIILVGKKKAEFLTNFDRELFQLS